MAATNTVEVVIQARDMASAVFRSAASPVQAFSSALSSLASGPARSAGSVISGVGRAASGLASPFKAGASAAASFGNSIKTGVSKGITDATAQVKGFGNTVTSVMSKLKGPGVAGIFTAAFGGSATAVIAGGVSALKEFAAATMLVQRNTGMTADAASGLLAVMQRFGLDSQTAAKSLNIFAKQVAGAELSAEELASGAGKAKGKLLELGISLTDASGAAKPMGDVLLDVADRFKTMPDGAEKTALAMQLFGREGTKMIPMLNQGKQGILDLEASAKKMGLTLSQDNVNAVKAYGAASKDMNQALAGLKLQIGVAVMPLMTLFAQHTAQTAQVIIPLLTAALKVLATFLKTYVVPVFKLWFDTIKIVVDTIVGPLRTAFSHINTGAQGVVGAVSPLQKLFIIVRDAFLTFQQAITGKWSDNNGISVIHRIVGNLGLAFGIARDGLITFISAITGNWQDNNGISGIHRVIGNIGIAVREALPHIMAFAGQAMTALMNFGQFVMENVVPAVVSFAKAIGPDLIAGAQGVWSWFQGTALPALQQFGGYIVGTVVPAVVQFAQEMGPKIATALSSGWGFLQTVVIPAIQQFANFVTTTVIPAVTRFAEYLKVTVPPILQAFGQFWSEHLQPMIQAFLAWLTGNVLPQFRGMFDSIMVLVQTFSTWIQEHWDTIKTIFEVVLAAVAIIVVNAFQNISNIIQNVWPGIQQVVQGALDVIKGIIDTMTAIFSGDWGAAWQGIKDSFNGTWEIIKGIVDIALGLIKALLENAWREISTAASLAWDGIKAMLSGLWDGIKGDATSVWEGIKGIIGGAWDWLQQKFDGGKTALKNAITAPFDEAKTVLEGIGSGIKSALSVPWNAAANGLNAWFGGFANIINGIADKLHIGDKINISVGSIPTFAKGGITPGGPILAGEQGPEIIVPPAMWKVLTATQTVQLAKALGMEGKPHPDAGRGFGNPISGVVDAAKGFAGDVAGSVRDFIANGAAKVVEEAMSHLPGISGLSGILTTLGGGIVTTLKDGIIDAFEHIFEDVKNALPAPQTYGGGVPGPGYSTGNYIIDMAQQTGGTRGWCEKFVGDVMQRLGLHYSRYDTALLHAYAQPLNPGFGPVGSIEFFPYDDLGDVAFNAGPGGLMYGTEGGPGFFRGGAPLGWTDHPAYRGGTIYEPVAGIGLRSGQSYSFAEHGPETVTPHGGFGPGAGGPTVTIQQLTINAGRGANGRQIASDFVDGLNDAAGGNVFVNASRYTGGTPG